MDDARILVVDDDREIANAIEKLLSMEGYQVIKAYNGLEALDAMVSNSIQLILLDVMMPKLDGLSTTLKIREDRNIPIIIPVSYTHLDVYKRQYPGFLNRWGIELAK